MTALTASIALRAGALDLEVALEVDERGLVLVGPNGAGKTTVLLSLVGARRPARGRIAIAGDVVFDSAGGVDRPTEERGLAYLPQSYALFPHLTAAQNVAFGLRGPRAERLDKARALLGRLGVGAVAERHPGALSGGEQQRVALARALVLSPKLLLADEPTGNLDTRTSEDVIGILQELNDQGETVLLITHEPDIAHYAKRIILLRDGKIVKDEPIDQVRAVRVQPVAAGGKA
jgi:ABC-type sulfate/molybdate transport systems ATPase subunit